jgi:drug/metabolite transporter (DMT)-like permease
MKSTSTTSGLVIALIAAATFGMSGAFIKPLLEAGWSPAAAVTARALIGGIVLAPFAVAQLRGSWAALWRSRWRVLAMALIGVAGTQLVYFAALQRIPVGTAILIEYMAPLLLVGFVWATSRRIPKAVVLIGSVVALVGLVLVVSPSARGSFDILGLASSGLIIGGGVLAFLGLIGVLPFSATFGTTRLFGASVPWWLPLAIVGILATAVAYAASITASEILGSRLASFMGLLEVVAATFYAWILLGEKLSIAQLIGGVLILGGIAFVRSEKTSATLEPAEFAEAPR